MGKQSWATEEQLIWLKARKKGLVDAQSTSRTEAGRFLAASGEAFLNVWPIDPATPEEIDSIGKGSLKAAEEAKKAARCKQVRWWLINHTRGTVNGKNSSETTAVLPLTIKKGRVMLPYQAYMSLYSDTLMAEIRKEYSSYRETASAEGREPKGQWAFTMEAAQRRLSNESEAVKMEVEAYRQEHHQETLPPVFSSVEELLAGNREKAQKQVLSLQSAIELLPKTGKTALEAIEKQTGWKGTLLVGGPHPETGRLVTLAIHNGRTVGLNNLFCEACEDWPKFQRAFERFIASGFSSELPVQLQSILEGKIPDVLPEEETATASSSAGASSSTAPSVASPHKEPEAKTSSPTPASNPEDGRPALPALQPKEILTEVVPPPPSYEEMVAANVARNRLLFQKVMGTTGAREIAAALAAEEKSDGRPQWIVEGEAYLRGVSNKETWTSLVDTWLEFERLLEYPDGQSQRNWLTSKGRPEEVKFWTGRGRKYNREPMIKSIPHYATTWKRWWTCLQPSSRCPDGIQTWPLVRAPPEDPADWSGLKRGGSNGFFMIVMCLAWWLKALAADDADMSELLSAVEDATWVCRAMTGQRETPIAAMDKPVDTQSSATTSTHPASPAPTPNKALSPASPVSTTDSPPPNSASPVPTADGPQDGHQPTSDEGDAGQRAACLAAPQQDCTHSEASGAVKDTGLRSIIHDAQIDSEIVNPVLSEHAHTSNTPATESTSMLNNAVATSDGKVSTSREFTALGKENLPTGVEALSAPLALGKRASDELGTADGEHLETKRAKVTAD